MSNRTGVVRGLVLAAWSVAAVGCDEERVAEIEDHVDVADGVTFRGLVDNGIELNGVRFNGVRFNGVRFNGVRFNGVRFNGVALQAVRRLTYALSEVSLTNGSLIRAVRSDTGAELVGGELIDTEIDLGYQPTAEDPEERERLKIAAIVRSAAQPDVYFNTVMRQVGTGWESLCQDGAGEPVEAIALQNDWDVATGTRLAAASAITWACRGAALAKCVEWGYRPWASVGGASLADYHQACTRLVRADYCGDGTAHTTNGTPIDVADDLGIQEFATDWDIEAKWGPGGAICLNHTRKLGWSTDPADANYIGCSIPACDDAKIGEDGALLANRSVPN